MALLSFKMSYLQNTLIITTVISIFVNWWQTRSKYDPDQIFKLCERGSSEELRKHIKAHKSSIDIDAKNPKGNSALHMAILSGNWEIVQIIMANFRPTSDFHVKNSNGQTPLDLALTLGDKKTAKLIIANTRTKVSPLMLALVMDQFEEASSSEDEEDENVGREFECPVCFNEMVAPLKIFGCSGDHYICSVCVKQCKKCPQCRENFATIAPTRRYTSERIAALIFSNDEIDYNESTSLPCK